MIVNTPDEGLKVIGVKTGTDPPFTYPQMACIPVLQLGGHIYSTDPRITSLGLEPGKPFPAMPVFRTNAPGPNQAYTVDLIPGPTIIP